MNEQIQRGRTLLVVLLSAVCLIFFVNMFQPLYLSPPDSSNRILVFALMCMFAGPAYKGARGMRAAISVVLFFLALVDSLVLFAAISGRRLGASVFLGSIIFVHVLIGWSLLASRSIRAFEAARQQRTAKIQP